MKRSPDFRSVAYMIRDKSRTEKEMNKISTWPHTSSCIQYLAQRKQWQNKTFYLGLQLCFTKVWDYKEIFPEKQDGKLKPGWFIWHLNIYEIAILWLVIAYICFRIRNSDYFHVEHLVERNNGKTRYFIWDYSFVFGKYGINRKYYPEKQDGNSNQGDLFGG